MVEKILVKTGELIEFNPSKTHEKDTRKLCGARHTVQIGIIKNPDSDTIVPFDDYIIVYFEPSDTSGGGEVMEWLGTVATVISGGAKIFTDPKDYYTTVTGGFGGALADISTDRGVVYGEGVVGNIAVGVKKTGDAIKKLKFWADDHSSPHYTPLGFSVEEPTSVWGTHYHGLEGGTHKIRITITNTYEGKAYTRYRSDLAGCRASYKEDDDCILGATFKRFLINAPGEWTVKVEPVATGSCEPLSYTEPATYTVPEPEGWKQNEISVMSTNISLALQGAGLPVYVSPIMLVGAMSLIGGLLFFKFYKKKKG